MKLISVCVALLLCACTQQDHARSVLQKAGYTNISMNGYDWFACSNDDTYHDSFTATSPTGQPVSGTVCAGLFFKGSTIRFD